MTQSGNGLFTCRVTLYDGSPAGVLQRLFVLEFLPTKCKIIRLEISQTLGCKPDVSRFSAIQVFACGKLKHRNIRQTVQYSHW
jgi:hypothetical protein